MDKTTTRLIAFARKLRSEDLPPAAVQAAKARLLSAVAVALAAFEVEPVRIARKLAQSVADGPAATLLGTTRKTTPDMAAFVNSAMVRSLDMSDTYVMAAVSHPADALPAALAVAEAEGRSGAELLLAMAIAYEAQCRFVEVVPYNHHGWDQTPVVALGAALACGRLLGLSDGQMAHAIALAVVPNIALNQTRTGTLSMWKGMAGPQGARAGVLAAYMAREGMTGPEEVFEGKFGFWNQVMKGEAFDLPIPSSFEKHTFAIQQTMIKSFPTRFNCQVPVFTAQKLRQMLAVGDIAELKIESIRQAFARWMASPEIWKPQTRETADHSLPCTVAMALLDGTITPRMMEEGRYQAPDVLALMAKCKIELPDDIDALAPATRCCRLTATLKDGRVVKAEYRRTVQDDAADPGWQQSIAKFEGLTSDMPAGIRSQDLIECVSSLDRKAGVSDLLRLATPRASISKD